MRVPRFRLIVLLALSSVSLLAQGQSDLPQFRAGVELVQLDVAVLDDKRQPVRGLTAADFTVLDNGVATPIRAFTPVELAPRTRATEAVWADEAPPDVVTNQVGQQDGRLVIILMDRSIPVHQPTVVARKIAAAAVEALGPDDLAAVISTNNAAVQDRTVQNLTADRARLLRAINQGDPSTGISKEAEGVWAGVGLTLDPLADGRCLCGLCVLEAITRVADAVQHTPRRRKVLFFIGSNVIWQSTRSVAATGDDPGCEIPLKDARAALFAAVDRANLTVHAIDPQGLSSVGPQTRASTPNRRDTPNKMAATARLEGQLTETNDLLTGQQNIRVLPDRTGGRTVIGRNNPEETVPEIFRESEAYYVLGVERGTSGRPDAARSIEVKVGRKGATGVCAAEIPRAVPGECVCRRAGAGSVVVQSRRAEPAAPERQPAARAGRHRLRQSRRRQAHRPSQRRYGSVRPQRRQRRAAGHHRHGDRSDRPAGRVGAANVDDHRRSSRVWWSGRHECPARRDQRAVAFGAGARATTDSVWRCRTRPRARWPACFPTSPSRNSTARRSRCRV